MIEVKSDYLDQSKTEAVDCLKQFANEIADHLINRGEVYLYDIDGFDEYHHETHVNRAYNLLEAAILLTELKVFEETDHGLWENLPLETMLDAKAAYTYGNAVFSAMDDILTDLQEDSEIDTLLEDEAVADLAAWIESKLPNFYPTTEEK